MESKFQETNEGVLDPRMEALKRKKDAKDRARFIENLGRLEETDHICRRCMDYYGKNHNGRFYPPCNMTCQVQEREKEARGDYFGLTEAEITNQKVINNPVAFAKVMFDWEARTYQEELLLCSAKRKVVRAGRRIGKSESMAIAILWLIFTRPEFRCIVICPYEYQVKLIFDVIRKMIQRSDIYKGEITRDVHDPHTIELRNGSYVVGFTAGVKTGEKANKVRGQGADAVFLDEVDYLDDGSIESLLALYADNREVMIWASSTPTGKRQHFFHWCNQKEMGWKEYHYTSRVSPQWDDETEMFFLSIYSNLGFTHEFEAEFGESETSVFRSKYVDLSLEDYEYKDISGPRKNQFGRDCIYVMGVDWNSAGVGTHIVVSEYDPGPKDPAQEDLKRDYKIRVVYKEIVDPEEFTQQKAIERIVHLSMHWDVDWVYCDKGYGTTQIEELHQYGQKYPKSGLHKKVKAIDMGGKMEIRDPKTANSSIYVKKYIKTLMVEIAARRVEELQCRFPRSEDSRDGLVEQIRNYEIIRYAENGKPIYTKENEHTAVAWMLSVFALMTEYTGLVRGKVAKGIKAVTDFGKPTDEKVVAGVKKKVARKIATVPSRTLGIGANHFKSLEVTHRQLGMKLPRKPRSFGRRLQVGRRKTF